MMGHKKVHHWIRQNGAFRAATVVIVGIVALSLVPSSRAQMVECRGVTALEGYKVLLDDIAGGPGSENLLNRLYFKLDASLEQARVETGVPITVVRCEKRSPRGEGDFPKEEVEGLNDNDVLLEVWGRISTRTHGGEQQHEVRIGYVLIPVRYYEHFENKSPLLRGVYTLLYPKDLGTSVEEAIDLLEEATELNIYTAISLGLNSLKMRKYNLALKYLNKGEALLRLSQGEPQSWKGPLLGYVRQLIQKTMQEASCDDNYKGGIKVIAEPCRNGGG